MKRFSKRQLTYLIFVVLVVSTLIRIFIIDSFIVRGDSMAPTIQPGDYVFINKRAYRFGLEPSRGDIVVSEFPNESVVAIKRVVGMPRERVEITPKEIRIKEKRNDRGEVLDERGYINLPNLNANGTTTIKLDPREYFLLGDNRFVSIDSRNLGPVSSWDLYGKVLFAFRIKSFSFFTPE